MKSKVQCISSIIHTKTKLKRGCPELNGKKGRIALYVNDVFYDPSTRHAFVDVDRSCAKRFHRLFFSVSVKTVMSHAISKLHTISFSLQVSPLTGWTRLTWRKGRPWSFTGLRFDERTVLKLTRCLFATQCFYLSKSARIRLHATM